MGSLGIDVVFKDGSRGNVLSQTLDLLLASGEVATFRRSSGWVIVGQDPIRRKSRSRWYAGVERRSRMKH